MVNMILASLELSIRNGGEVSTLVTPSHHQDLPTRRTRRVGPEPRVDASHVEDVPALRQDPNLVSLRKLAQAYGTLRSHLRRRRRSPVAVRELRELLEDLLLQPLVGRGGLGRAGTAAAAASAKTGRASQPRAAGHGQKPHDADDGAEQRRQYDDEVGFQSDGLGRWRGGIFGG